MHPLDGFYLIKEIITFGTNMTMNCPLCGALMVCGRINHARSSNQLLPM
jgi:hypothetical protein